MRIERFPNNPIIRPNMDARMGDNINGPSLIRVPDWVKNPLGRYYLYFGHHKGEYIRLAFADQLEGPWTTFESGVLNVQDAHCRSHIASPDVHVDHENQEIRMYYHGPVQDHGQKSKVALSKDGLHFTAYPENLGNPYFRVFHWKEYTYALGMPALIYRSKDGLTNFQEGPTLPIENIRHNALKLEENRLTIFYSRGEDCPERILCRTLDLTPDWMDWQVSEQQEVLAPETHYEGVDLPLEPSSFGWSPVPVRQLRDPDIYCEGPDTYLLYTVAGESGIAMARLLD